MKRKYSFILLFVAIFTLSIYSVNGVAASYTQQLEASVADKSKFLEALEGLNAKGYKVTDIEQLKIGDKMKLPFKEKYVMTFEQLVDHNDPSVGTFKQRVIVGFEDFDSPSEIVTEGYGAAYGLNPNYRDEPSRLFKTNMVLVEHRYFLTSVPFRAQDSTLTDEKLNWDYMNAKQAAADLHNIITAFKTIFHNKWIASGISKGGQTTMFYTTYYPNDMDISIPYVGPLCKGLEDGRHEPFIANFCGTPEQRAKIQAYQRELLKRRATIEPILSNYIKANDLKYNMPLSEVLDYSALEFSFAFWQWGYDTDIIPDLSNATDNELFMLLLKVSGPDYFAEGKDSSPFYVQAARELGYYGYDTTPFKDLLTIKSSKGYLKKLFIPYARDIKFSTELYNDVRSFLEKTNNKMMFIYGEYDPWSSVMPEAPVKNEQMKKQGKGRETMVLYIDPKGSHRARISTLPEEKSKEAIRTIEKWLAE